jgi:hypothetical protein
MLSRTNSPSSDRQLSRLALATAQLTTPGPRSCGFVGRGRLLDCPKVPTSPHDRLEVFRGELAKSALSFILALLVLDRFLRLTQSAALKLLGPQTVASRRVGIVELEGSKDPLWRGSAFPGCRLGLVDRVRDDL